MDRKEIRSRIEEIGIIPAVRVPSEEDARFAAEAVAQGGIPVVEIAMTVPGAIRVIAELVRLDPTMIVGAGSVVDAETARRCVDAGARFLTTDGVVLEVVEFANEEDMVVFPGALTPTEVVSAWRAGSDFVKIVLCAAVGGENYLRALKTPFAEIPLIAAGGVNQATAPGYLAAGAVALGIGQALLPWEAVALRQSNRIGELARRFLGFVSRYRVDTNSKRTEVVTNPATLLAWKEA